MSSSIVSTSCCCLLSWSSNHRSSVPSTHLVTISASEKGCSSISRRIRADSSEKVTEVEEISDGLSPTLGRRSAMVSGVSLVTSATVGFPGDCLAVVKQGLLAGRVPGLSEPDKQGWRTYQRPEDKSGGHGVGWSPIIPYAFSVPQDWDEVPVSIADLGGTEIDLRFASPKQGRLFVIVAPCKRFSDVIDDDAKIEQIGPPEKVINAFGPEVIGENVEGKVLSAEIAEHSGRKYYLYELEPPHVLITATAAGNRLYLFSITGNGLQWKRHYKDLKRIAESFRVI